MKVNLYLLILLLCTFSPLYAAGEPLPQAYGKDRSQEEELLKVDEIRRKEEAKRQREWDKEFEESTREIERELDKRLAKYGRERDKFHSEQAREENERRYELDTDSGDYHERARYDYGGRSKYESRRY